MRSKRITNNYKLKLATTFRRNVGRAQNFGAFKSPEDCRILHNRFMMYIFPKPKIHKPREI